MSFILGILGMFLSFILIGSFLCLVSLILGFISLRNIYSEKWPAVCGIASSFVGTIITLVMAFEFYKDHPDFFTVIPKAFGIQSENDAESSDKREVVSASGRNSKEADTEKMIDINENIFSVELTISSEYTDVKTQKEWDDISKEMGYKSIKLNSDGSVTYQMTKAQHAALIEETRKNLNDSLKEMIGTEEYPNIIDIKSNDNFTEFTVTTTSEELSLSEELSTIMFYFCGGIYNSFSGETVDNISVTFVNADTGNIISQANSRDMGNNDSASKSGIQ